jgi:cysteine desulfurase/selenocysteine lyase
MSIPPTLPLPRLPREQVPPALDVARVRQDFPVLRQKVHGHPLIYLDNAATTQKPQPVLDALNHYYAVDNANVHRGVHRLSQRATEAYEAARIKVASFLNAKSARDIVFTRGTTESINLVAATFGRKHVGPGDEVLITWMEHHSNIVPWQMLCQERGATLKVVPINDKGELLLDEYRKLLSPRTKLAAFVHVSNSLGTVNPVKQMVAWAHEKGVPVLLDGAQAVSHFPVDVQEIGCDFYCFSGHKLYGPTGIGVLFGKTRHLEDMPPYRGGGDMIASVTFEKTTYAGLPNKFEAGTPHVAGAVGLAAAIDYVTHLGLDNVRAHEDALLRRATEALKQIPGVRLIGTAAERAAAVSFVVEEPPLSALDVGTLLDLKGIAVRTGHHCCQPVVDRFGLSGTARASFAAYNTFEEVDQFAAALRKIVADAERTRPVAADVPKTELAYPKAVAESPREAAEELVEAFDLLEDWNERYGYLIKLGTKLPPMPDVLKTDANRVRGCQSTVFMHSRTKPGRPEVIEFLADSDADLVRGLLAVLQRLFSGQPAAEVVTFDVEQFFGRLGLDQHLTLGRRNGLAEMVKRVRNFAAGVAAAS